jgi:Sulfotransferase family
MSAAPAAAPPTVAGPWRPRTDEWLAREPSRYAGKPDRPLIIGGCRRSGTTLLRSMLDNHPDLAVPAETDFLVPLYQYRARYGDLRDPANRRAVGEWIFAAEGRGGRRIRGGLSAEEAIERIVASPPTLGSLFATCFQMYAERHGKPRWGDKRPRYAGQIRTIFALFPDAQFVNVVRDPRGAVSSQIAIKWYDDDIALEASTVAWEMAIDRVDSFAPRLRPDQLLDVRYEDLVRDPAGELRRVCAFADLRDGETIEHMINAERRGTFREGWHDRLSEPISTAPIDSWRKRLEREHVALVEHATGDRFERLGYRRIAEGTAPDRAALRRLAAQRRERRRYWRRWAWEELKRRHVVARHPVAAVSSRWP